MTLDEYEQDMIREALRRADGNKSHAARLLASPATPCATAHADGAGGVIQAGRGSR